MSAAANGIDGEYIVVLKEGANPRSVAAVAGVEPAFVYTAALNGFAAPLNQGQLNALRHNPERGVHGAGPAMSIDDHAVAAPPGASTASTRPTTR